MNRVFLSALAPLVAIGAAMTASAQEPQILSNSSLKLKGAYSSAWIDDHTLVVGGLDNSARLVDATGGTLVVKDVFNELVRHRSISERAGIGLAVAFDARDPQEKRILVGGTGGVVETWNLHRTHLLVSSKQFTSSIKLLVREPNGRRIAVSDGHAIAIYSDDVPSAPPTLPTVLPAGKSNVASLTWFYEPGLATTSPEALIVGREDGRYELREGDLTTVSEGFAPFEADSNRFTSVQRPKDGNTRIASLGDDSVYRLWKVTPVAQLPPLQGGEFASHWVLSRSGKRLAAADEKWLYLWSLPARTPSKVPPVANTKPIAIACDDAGSRVAVLAADAIGQRSISLAYGPFTTLIPLDLTLTSTLPLPKTLSCIALSPDGQRIAVGYDTGEIFIGDLNPSRQIAANGNLAVSVCLAGTDEQLSGIRFIGNKPLLISSSGACRLTVWNTDDATVAGRISTARSIGAWDVVVMNDGRSLVAAGMDSPNGDLLLAYLNCDGTLDDEMWTHSPKSDGVVSLHFTADGGRLTTTCSDGCAHVWDTVRLIHHVDPDGNIAADTGLIEAVIPQGGDLTDAWFWGDDQPLMSIVAGRIQFSRFTALPSTPLDVPGRDFHLVALSCDLDTAVFLDKSSTTIRCISLSHNDSGDVEPTTISSSALGAIQPQTFRKIYLLTNPDPIGDSSQGGNAKASGRTAHLLTIQDDGMTICHWDARSGELISSVALAKGIKFLCVGSADQRVLAVLADSSIEALDFSERTAENIPAGAFPANSATSSSELTALDFAADDSSVVAGYADGALKRHLLGAEKRCRIDPSDSRAPLYAMLVDKEVGVVLGYANGLIRRPDIAMIHGEPDNPIYAFAKDLTPDTQRVFVAKHSCELTRLSFTDGGALSLLSTSLSTKDQYYTSVSTSSDFVAAGVADVAGKPGMVNRWKLADWNEGAIGHALPGKEEEKKDGWNDLSSPVYAVAYSPKGKWLAAVKAAGLLQVWDKDGKPRKALALPHREDGSVVYCGLSWNGTEDRLAITSVRNGQLEAENDAALVIVQMK